MRYTSVIAGAVLSVPFFVSFAILLKPGWLLVVGCNIVACPIIRVACFWLLEKVQLSNWGENDMAYLCTLMSSQLSLLICSIVFVSSANAYGGSHALERLSWLCVMYSAVFTFQKAVLLFITANVTWKSYLSRIQDTVMAHQIVQGFKNFVAEETTVIDIDCALSRDSLLSLKSVHRAKDITDVSFTDDPSQLFDTVLSSKKLRLSSGKAPMYNTLMKRLMLSPHREVAAGPASTPSAPYSGQHLTTEHIKVIFGNTAMHVAEILDRNGDGLVDKEEFVRIFEDIRSDAVNLKETLKDFEKISETLNRALTALSLIVTSFAALAILGVNLLQNSVVIVSVFVASSIVFGSSMQRFFEGIILVFASKPYEVGDRVLIDGMYLLVKNISILTTTSVGADGQYCILSNSQLKDAVIINAYRSGESSQRWSILVPCTVPPTYCEDLEAHLKNLNVVGVEGIDCWFDKCRADGVNDVIIVSARQRTNFQNVVTKARIGKQLAAGIKVFTADLPSPAHILATPGFGENV